MIVGSRALSRVRLQETDDVETLQTLVIFSGAGLLLSLVFALLGWM